MSIVEDAGSHWSQERARARERKEERERLKEEASNGVEPVNWSIKDDHEGKLLHEHGRETDFAKKKNKKAKGVESHTHSESKLTSCHRTGST